MKVLLLPARLDLAAAVSLLPQFRVLSTQESDCYLNGEKVTSVGTACVQTLLAFESALTRKGSHMILIEASPVLVDGLKQLGLEAVINRWMAPQ